MTQKFYGNNFIQFASKLFKFDRFQAQFQTRCHRNSIDFNVVYRFYFCAWSATNHKIVKFNSI